MLVDTLTNNDKITIIQMRRTIQGVSDIAHYYSLYILAHTFE